MKKKLVLRFFWVFGTLLLILLGLVFQTAYHYDTHLTVQKQTTEQMRFDINTVSTRSTTMGVVIAMGLVSENLKDRLATSEDPGLDAILRYEFASLVKEYESDVAFLTDAKGRIITYYNQLQPNLDSHQDISFRPYWQLAMRGLSTVYPAVGITDGGRGFYIAAPVHETLSNDSPPVGVLSVRMNAKILDETLSDYKSPAMIVSSDGVVFASNQPDWVLKLTRELTKQQHSRLIKQRQFGDEFSKPEGIKYLPFKINGEHNNDNEHVIYQGSVYSVTAAPLDWSDSQGQWYLVVMENTNHWLTWWERLAVIVSVAVFMLGLYLIVKLRNRIEQNAVAAVYAQQQIQQKAKQHLKNLSDALPLAIFQITQNQRFAH